MGLLNNYVGLSLNEASELVRQARLNLAKRYAKEKNILGWGKLLFPDKFVLPFCHKLHSFLIENRKASRLNIEAPRNHAKTTIECFLIPIFGALEEPDTFRHYLNVQSTYDKAVSINQSIKHEFETNEDLFDLYGDQTGRVWTDGKFVLRNGTIFTAAGVGQSIRGINYLNKRPDFINVDDLYDEDDISNPTSTKRKNAWFWGTLYPARAKGRENVIHVLGTAINEYDLLNELKQNTEFNSKTFRAIEDFESREVLWPELNTFESLIADRGSMGSIIFNREMQNVRRDRADAIIKDDWIKDYNPLLLKFNERFKLVSTLLLVDPSIGEKEQSDYTGIILMLKCRYADSEDYLYFVENAWNLHLSLNQRVEKLMSIRDSQPKDRQITECRIEAIAGFKDFAAEVKRRTSLHVKEINAVKNKIANLENKSRFFENGKIFISSAIDKITRDMLINQLTTNFPNHDDMRDALLLGLDDVARTFITVV